MLDAIKNISYDIVKNAAAGAVFGSYFGAVDPLFKYSEYIHTGRQYCVCFNEPEISLNDYAEFVVLSGVVGAGLGGSIGLIQGVVRETLKIFDKITGLEH